MIEVKTCELLGKPLNWVVAQYADKHVTIADIHWENYCPSTDWAVGGPIVEREKISIMEEANGTWLASIGGCTDLDMPLWQEHGPTPLVAAMRCLVAAKRGDTVKIPKRLFL